MSQQIGVCAVDEIFRRVAVIELCEADRDRAAAAAAGQSTGHVGKTLPDLAEIGIRQRAHELVAAVAHHQVVGAQARSQGVSDGEQQRIARHVTIGVVDLLQAIHIDEGDHELGVCAARAVHLALKLLHPSAASADVRQLIDLRGRTVDRGLSTISRGQGALLRGLRSFLSRARTIIGRSCTIGRSTSTIIGGPLTIAGLAEGPVPLWLALRLQGRPRMITRRLASVSHLRDPIALGGRLIALISGDLPRHPSSQTRVSLLVAQVHRMLAMQASRLANLLVSRPVRF